MCWLGLGDSAIRKPSTEPHRPAPPTTRWRRRNYRNNPKRVASYFTRTRCAIAKLRNSTPIITSSSLHVTFIHVTMI